MRSQTTKTVKRSKWFLSAFSISDTSETDNYKSISATSFALKSKNKEKIKVFSTKRIVRESLTKFHSLNVLKKWEEKINLKLKFLISISENKHRIFILLYQYKHSNSVDFTDLFCIDIILHNVDLISETKSYAINFQKRWLTYIEWWIQKIIQNNIDKKIYKCTQIANEQLSSWNVRAIVINKMKNLIFENKFRITFNYSKIKKIMSNVYMKLNFKVHDILLNLRHDVLYIINFKYAYSIISLIEKCKYYFASTISEIN